MLFIPVCHGVKAKRLMRLLTAKRSQARVLVGIFWWGPFLLYRVVEVAAAQKQQKPVLSLFCGIICSLQSPANLSKPFERGPRCPKGRVKDGFFLKPVFQAKNSFWESVFSPTGLVVAMSVRTYVCNLL